VKIFRLEGDFVNSVRTLVTGTIFSQLIVFALYPIISRLYSPEENASFSIYSRIILFVSTIATARFETALLLPKRNEHAFSLYRLIIQLVIITFFISIILSFIYVFFNSGLTEESFIYLMIPVGLVPLSMMTIGNVWAMRFGEFKVISKIKVINSLLMNFSNVFFGWIGLGYKGLIIGYIVGVSIPGLFFLRKYHLLKLKYKDFSTRSRKRIMGKTYLEFPKINLPHTLIDLTRELVLVLFILFYFNKNILGSYDFSFKILKLPLTVLGVSIGQVYFQNIAKKRNKNESIYEITKQTIKNLFLISIIPFTILFFWGSELFSFIFGEEWKLAGKYSEIMSPWLLLNLIVSPISHLPAVIGKLKSFFYVGLVGSILLIGMFIIPYYHTISFDFLLYFISYSQTVFLIFVLFWFIRLSYRN
jgi:O-antigen/teichoic acid export membrane protein